MTSNRITVLVLMGGPDAEREVSLMSGKETAQALRDCGQFAVLERTIDDPSVDELGEFGGDVVFPVLHGPWGEGGHLQERLELLGKPFVGSPSQAARLAMDKLATKSMLSAEGVPTPPARSLGPDDVCDLTPPLVLKPIDDGSSIDLFICRTEQEVNDARAALHPKRGRIMAEKYIAGRELTVGIVQNEPLPLIEIVPAVEFYDYDAKYFRNDTRYKFDPDVPADVADRCAEIAMHAFGRLRCRDLARVDLMLDEDGLWFLEINTMPGFTTHSLVPMAAAHAGLDMPQLCATLVHAALARSPIAAAGTR
ncbi:MAG: D-alanine--D-alanine ligase [Phycisphaerales bacterium]